MLASRTKPKRDRGFRRDGLSLMFTGSKFCFGDGVNRALIASESDPPDDFYICDVPACVYSTQENDNSFNLVPHRQHGILQPCHDGLDAADRFREFIDLDDESAVIGGTEFLVYELPFFLSCQGA